MTTIPKSESWRMFNDISPKYDFLNRVLAFGLDVHWRRVLARHLPQRPDLKVLDLATGTADILLAVFKNNPNVCQGVGLDMAEKMLEVGRAKIAHAHLAGRIRLDTGDAHNIAQPAGSFDAVTIAFGIRNMNDPQKVLMEMNRVLAVGGRALVLEFSMPSNRFIRFFHLFYLRRVVPLIGGLLTGHYKAYRYLNQTIESFPYGDRFCDWMRQAGFVNVQAYPLLFGTATVYQGERS